jgi:hypothetical protein
MGYQHLPRLGTGCTSTTASICSPCSGSGDADDLTTESASPAALRGRVWGRADLPGAAIRFTDTLAFKGLVTSIGSVGDAYDNAAADNVMGLFKTEPSPPAHRYGQPPAPGLLRCRTGPTTRGVLTPEDGMNPGTVQSTRRVS